MNKKQTKEAKARVTAAEVECGTCLNRIRVQIYSAGMGDELVFVCPLDSTVLSISTWNRELHKKLESLFGGYPQTAWTDQQISLVEEELIPCPCGGAFEHRGLPKCPKCGAILSIPGWRGRSKLDKSVYMMVEGTPRIDGDKQNVWR